MYGVVDRFDLANYVTDQGGSKIQTGEWLLDCPECGKDKLTVNVLKRVWHCWVCEEYETTPEGKRKPVRGAGGVIRFVMWMEQCDYAGALKKITESTVWKPPDKDQVAAFDLICDARELANSTQPLPIPEGWSPVDGTLPYMIKRGILPDDAQLFHLGWCKYGRYAGRLVFPVYEEGQLVYYQARAMWEESEEPEGRRYIKSLNPPKQEGCAVSSEVLMNLDNARHYDRVAITEGPIDCVHVGADAVCTFGKKMSAAQIGKLLRSGVRAVDMMWDGPSEREPQGAWPEMIRTAQMLAPLFDVRLVFLPQGDPGDYSREQLTWFRSQSRPLVSGIQTLTI